MNIRGRRLGESYYLSAFTLEFQASGLWRMIIYIYIYIYIYVFIDLCLYSHLYLYLYLFTYIYIYIYVCVHIYTYMSKSINWFSGHKRGVVLINWTKVLHAPSLRPDAYFDPGRCQFMVKIQVRWTYIYIYIYIYIYELLYNSSTGIRHFLCSADSICWATGSVSWIL